MSWLKNLFEKEAANLISSVGDAFDKNFTNEEERINAKAAIIALLTSFINNVNAVKADVLKVELSGNWLQRSWRPLIMLSFGFIVIYRYFIAPTFMLPMAELPENFWDLLELGLGGYVIGRSAEKIFSNSSFNFSNLGKK